MKLNEQDQRQLDAKGITLATLEQQLKMLAEGFPYLRLAGSAKAGNGISVLDDAACQKAIERWQRYLADGGKVTKFVPASGAASRMFKDLFEYVNSEADQPEAGSVAAKILEHLNDLPFRAELDRVCQSLYGMGPEQLADCGRNKDLVRAIISPEGMNYGALPKALLTFHRYADGSTRTALEEQFAEGAQTAAVNGNVDVHFTVSADHRKLFEKMIEQVKPEMERLFGVKYNVTMSEQKPSTDTVAGAADNSPFRDEQGRMVFRPGGHGALIENLNDLDSTVVFIKNIDNVVPDSQRESTVRYKQVLGGVLMAVHDRIARYLQWLDGEPTAEQIAEMTTFLGTTLCTVNPAMATLDAEGVKAYLRAKFNRPLRVCGMVRNEGEPGGGPYIAYNADGTASPQILESSQIDKHNPEALAMMQQATHFNPVDLVCYIADVEGRKYHLPDYVDRSTGFISSKSLHGRELKALELPGLWNGAMSDWSTVFVEVPASTFNPVKTVADLLRPAHRG